MRPVRGPVNVAGRGQHLAQPPAAAGGQGAAARPGAAVPARRSGSAGGSASARLPPEAVPWLRNGLTIDCTRLIEEVGFRPRSTLEAVEDFVEELHGRRVLPGLRTAATGSATDRNGRATRPRPRVTPDRHAAQRERARRLRLDVARAVERRRAGRRSRAEPGASAGRRPRPRARRFDFLGALRERDRARAATSRRRSSGAAGALPGSARDVAAPRGAAPARRVLAGRVGLRRGVRRDRLSVVRAHVRALVAGDGDRRRERARRTTARCSSPTTPACCRGTRR